MGDIGENRRGEAARNRLGRLLLLALWAAVTLYLASQHVMWRDEVRALSIALQGDTIADMLRGLQGEGHPALWYLALRLAHSVVPMPQVLAGVAWLIAAGAMAILALRSPFRLTTIALIMFGGFGLYEYVVSARNYGIGMLVLFAVAALYPRHRDRGVLIGLLLALLCNTNVHAAFFAAGLLGFWLVEITCEEGLRWTRKHFSFLVNALVAVAGAALCFITVYPPAHDAAVKPHPDGITAQIILQALGSPADAFAPLLPWQLGWGPVPMVLLTLLLVGAVLGLIRRPAALLAAAGVLILDQLFFQLVYPGDYRHTALFLTYLVTLYWLAAQGRGGSWPRSAGDRLERVARLGGAALTMLLALQLPYSIGKLSDALGGVPQTRVRDLTDLLEQEGLSNAILIANADVILEPVPYYADHPLYLIREGRFGHVTRFTRDARIHLSLDSLIDEARGLQASSGRPVIILMQHHLEPGMASSVHEEGFGGSFSMPADQVEGFLSRTRRLASFEAAASDESYDVYLVTGS